MSKLKAASALLKDKLAGSAVAYTISSFLNASTSFFLLPVLTRYLTTDEYGVVSMFSATQSILLPFMGMSISSAVIRKLADGNAEEGRTYIFNALIVALTSSAVFSVLVMLLAPQISRWTAMPAEYLGYVLVYTAATEVCSTTLGAFQIQGKVKHYAVFRNASTLTNLLLSLLFVVVLHMSLRGRIYGLVFSQLLFGGLGLSFLVFGYGVRCRFDLSYIKDIIFSFSIPLIPTVIKGTVLTYTDKLFITNMLSVSDTGIYTVGNQFSMPIMILAQSFNLAFVPWLYEKLNQNDEHDKRSIVRMTYCYFFIAAALALMWTVAARIIVPIFAGKEYVGASRYVLYLSMGYAFTGMHMMVVNYIYYTKRIKAYALVTTTVMVINVVLNYFFINVMGAVGAAQATMISEEISFILTWILSARVYKMPWFERGILKMNIRKKE